MNSWVTTKGTTVYRILGERSNVFLVSRENHYILIDTSTKRNYRKLQKRLNSLPAEEGALRALILTHVHFDHAANAAKIREKYHASIFVHEREAALLESGRNAEIRGATPVTRFIFTAIMGNKILNRLRFEPSHYDIVVRDKYSLRDFGFNAYIIPTPGHTSGSMSVIVDDEIAVVGDAIFGVFPHSVFSPWAADRALMIQSWKILLDTGCSLYLPSHGRPRDRETLMKQYKKYSPLK